MPTSLSVSKSIGTDRDWCRFILRIYFRFVLGNWFMYLWMPASPESAGYVGKLETQEGDVIKSSEAVCWLNSLLFQRGESFLLGPSTAWTRPTRIMEGHLLYSKCADLNENLILKIPLQKYIMSYLIMSRHHDPSTWHIKLTIPGRVPCLWVATSGILLIFFHVKQNSLYS